MNDPDVARLRRLRRTALRARAVSLALGKTQAASHEPLLGRAACASWRIARAVSGRLRAHPYAHYQRDASGFERLLIDASAALLALGARRRTRALAVSLAQLAHLVRQVDDVRALTWTPDLSDTLGRSQLELRSLAAALEYEARGSNAPLVAAGTALIAERPAIGNDWPYLAF